MRLFLLLSLSILITLTGCQPPVDDIPTEPIEMPMVPVVEFIEFGQPDSVAVQLPRDQFIEMIDGLEVVDALTIPHDGRTFYDLPERPGIEGFPCFNPSPDWLCFQNYDGTCICLFTGRTLTPTPTPVLVPIGPPRRIPTRNTCRLLIEETAIGRFEFVCKGTCPLGNPCKGPFIMRPPNSPHVTISCKCGP